MRGLRYNELNTVTRGITVPGTGEDIHTVKRAFLRRFAGGSLGRSSHASHPVCDFTSVAQHPIQRTLQQYLGNGEYPLFQSIAMFESSFIQVTRKGKQVFIHNNCNQAIVGIATTNPKLPLPNIMFIARPGVGRVSSGQHREELMLTRLIPLKFVRISIHDSEKQLIKIKLINRRSYYLQLYSSTEDVKALFDCWLSLIRLLHHPPRSYLRPYTKSHTTRETLSVQVVPSEIAIETELDHDDFSDTEDEDWEDEMESLERKATKSKLQSQETIVGENYTKSEDYIIRMRSRLLTSSRRSLYSDLESFESYNTSQPAISMKDSTFSNIFSDDSDLTLSRGSLPPRQLPDKGSSSVNIVTIFSIVSDHADIGGGGKS
ncbi:Golgi-associated RAB2 interactor protein 5B-like [Heteronotia binoei]|uniref:Golgi-associated RAB2 interactor protein 5B-like n=1 Tax=Heteronotia binoei TaxID=13085 RepID=UPI00292EFBB9|nr:Golgi-associated RAB2 interactor protein 5B-like [Heteronotia binoei]